MGLKMVVEHPNQGREARERGGESQRRRHRRGQLVVGHVLIESGPYIVPSSSKSHSPLKMPKKKPKRK